MAKKCRKKTVKIKLSKRLCIWTAVAISVMAVVLCILHFTGIFTLDDMAIKLGIKDKTASNAEVEVHFIDVGQGDSTLVVSEGHAMLIDSGDVDGENKAIEYIKSLGISKLDCVIATHPHADHIGEMAEVIAGFEVEKFIMPKVPDDMTPTSAVYEKMLTAISDKGLKITKAENSSFTIGKAEVQLFVPKDEYSNLNNYSVLVKITDGDNSFLITGDCETDEENEMLAAGYDLSAKVLKVGHHGSKTSSSADFLDEVLPKYAVISVGEGNKYGHPADETLSRLEKYAYHIYETEDNGTIVFESDGEGLNVICEKGTEK